MLSTTLRCWHKSSQRSYSKLVEDLENEAKCTYMSFTITKEIVRWRHLMIKNCSEQHLTYKLQRTQATNLRTFTKISWLVGANLVKRSKNNGHFLC